MLNKKRNTIIMDIPFLNTTMLKLINENIRPRIDKKEHTFIVTANPEIVMKAREDDAYKKAVLSADYIVPDGIGIIKAAQWMKQPLTERIAGFDLMENLLKVANEESYRCYFLGATEEVNDALEKKLKEKYPNIQIAGRHHGFFELDDLTIVEKVEKSKPDLVFVALGLPRQEMWIYKNFHHFSQGVFVGVGGSFDVIAGKVKRAPKFWIKLNLEWFYRLAMQPFRWKRILKVFQFMFLIRIGKR